MELELGLGLSNYSTSIEMEIPKRDVMKNKSKSGEAFDHQINDSTEFEDKKLRLLLWSGQPNDEEDDPRRRLSTSNTNQNDIEEEESVIVGWPPINSLRKEMLHHYQYLHRDDENNNGVNVIVRNMQSLYVKVKMEGVGIGRKIDLRLFNSHQTLKLALLNMFSKSLRTDTNGTEYTILYQDKQGDWMLAGDVPWEIFMESVQRMQILRTCS